jgi:DDE superfamily endonuclease
MTMAGVRFADMRFRPTEFLDFTSLTVEEFEILIPPFEAAFQAHMTHWCLDGTPRTNRRFSVYRTCPLAAPEDRLFFLLTYLKTYTLQVVQGRLFGMGQSKANQWIHVLLPALLAALRDLGDAPTRCLTALARRLDVPDAATGVVAVSAEEPPAVVSPSAAPVAGSLSPLLPMTGRNGALSAPKTRLNRPNVTAARKRITR